MPPFVRYRPYPYTNHPGPRTPGPRAIATYGNPGQLDRATVATQLNPLRGLALLLGPLAAGAGYIRSGSLLFAALAGIVAPPYLVYLGLLKVSGEKKVLKRRKNGEAYSASASRRPRLMGPSEDHQAARKHRRRNARKRHHQTKAAYHRGALDAHTGRANGRKRRKRRRRNRR